MARINKIGFGVLLVAVMAGCGAEKSNSFIGHWVEVPGTELKPMTLDISLDENIFHVNERKNVLGKDFERKLEARSESSNTLSALGGALTMRLEGSRLFYNGHVLVKSP